MYAPPNKKGFDFMFIVIACYERDITCIGKAKTRKKAREIMKKSFLDFYEKRNEVYIENPEDYESGFGSDSAWTNIDSSENADWKIINLEEVE